jgi:hypothetical protein
MSKIVFVVLLAALVPVGALAVDGQALINQSTVMAQGGFPYVISTPGSYKLSGNLVMSVGPAPNYTPCSCDIAIAIAVSNVVLDLNGFTITVNQSLGPTAPRNYYAIAEIGTFSAVTIRNGSIRMNNGINDLPNVVGVSLPSSFFNTVRDVSVIFSNSSIGGFNPQGFNLGGDSLIIHNVTNGQMSGKCPSMVVENVFVSSGFANGALCSFHQ